ncbi:MAG: hypothetical protein ACI9XK_004132 [Granulosicoccus sp.]|jgi:hypothetical protein
MNFDATHYLPMLLELLPSLKTRSNTDWLLVKQEKLWMKMQPYTLNSRFSVVEYD